MTGHTHDPLTDALEAHARGEATDAQRDQIAKVFGADALQDLGPAPEDVLARTTARVHGLLADTPAPWPPGEQAAAQPPARPWWRSLLVPSMVLATTLMALTTLRSADVSHGTLPTYELTVRAGDKATRGAEPAHAATRTVSEGSQFELLLQPQQDAVGPVQAAVFRATPAGHVKLDLPVQVAPTGAVRVLGEASPRVFGQSSPATLRLVVSAGRSAPTAAQADAGPSPGMAIVDTSFELAWVP